MIYLDHAAATPVSGKALSAQQPYFSDLFFNPSAAYLPAKHLRAEYEEAKSRLAHLIGAKSPDLIITSGATESNNLALTCLNNINTTKSPHLLVLATEHKSILAAAKNYDYDTINVDHTGLVNQKDLKSKITDDTALISISLVNNELGVIQPLSEVAEIIKKVRIDRLKRNIHTPLFLHTDASQALNLLDVKVSRLGVDLLTFSSVKIYGPKGIGALYVSHDVHLSPLLLGGGQENGLRSGTENVPALMGFAAVAEDAQSHLKSSREKYSKLSALLRKGLESAAVPPFFLGNKKSQLANFVPVSFPGLDAERLIYILEEKEIYLSTGAACAANRGSESHVLKAIGLNPEEISGSLRITLGATNDEVQILEATREICSAVASESSRIASQISQK